MCRTSSMIVLGVALPLVAAGSTAAQWASDPMVNTPIAVVNGNQTVPKISARADGGAWMTWFDNRGGGYAVYIQRLDPFGVPQLGANGMLLSSNPQSSSLVDWDLITDSAGNAVVAFTDTRAGGDLDVYAYRVAPDGSMLWGANGVTLSANSNFEADPRIVETSTGLFVFTWTRSTLAGGSTPGLIMQTLNGAGVPQIAGDGLAFIGNPEVPAFQEMLPLSNGDVLVSYVRDTRTFSSPRHVRAARYTSAGTLVWGPVLINGSNVVPIAFRPKLASDGADGGVIAWHDGHVGGISNCFVQHVLSDGTTVFPANGAQVATGGNLRFDPAVAFNVSTGETFVTFNERDGAQGTRGQNAQKFNAAGAPQWGANGVVLSAFDSNAEGPARAWPFGDGAIFAFTDNPSLNFNRWLAYRVKGDGSFAWPVSPLIVSNPAGVKFRNPFAAVGATGVGMLLWEDQRTDPSSDLYAQNVNPDGSLGLPGHPCAGDADGNNSIGIGDIGVIIQNWSRVGLVGYLGDLNNDGARGLADIALVIQNWGGVCDSH
ncbi:MAG TPA: hypothetical protein VG797_04710 [Phycisphaerales bacterium]|nr:hypothetical protein [Phycisphaerales bacterium]